MVNFFIIGFFIAFGVLMFLINKLIFELGFNGHKDTWLMPMIGAITVVVTILVASILCIILSRVIKKRGTFHLIVLKLRLMKQDKREHIF